MLDYKILIIRDLCRLSYYMYYFQSVEDREHEYIGHEVHCKKVARELQIIGDSYLKITITVKIWKIIKYHIIALLIG